jgi:hypothetical protein
VADRLGPPLPKRVDEVDRIDGYGKANQISKCKKQNDRAKIKNGQEEERAFRQAQDSR